MKLLGDYSLQMSLQEGCRSVCLVDAFASLQRLVSAQRQGALFADCERCELCAARLVGGGRKEVPVLLRFGCGHVFHENCLILAEGLSQCPECGSAGPPAF